MASPTSQLFADLPTDTAHRFRLVAETVFDLGQRLTERPRLLDVGGYPCTFARAFRGAFPRWQTHTIDTPADSLADYTSGTGTELPFEDNSFDVVTCIDVLEHIPPAARPLFLSELGRVAARHVVLAAPFHHPATEQAEAMLDGAHQAVFRQPHPWLGEHVANGLPRLKEIFDLWPKSHGITRAEGSYDLAAWVQWQALNLAQKIRGELDLAWESWDRIQGLTPPPKPDPVAYRYLIVSEKGRPLSVRLADLVVAPEAGDNAVALARMLTGSAKLLHAAQQADSPAEAVARAVDERLHLALEAAETEIRSLRQKTTEQSQRTSGVQSLIGLFKRPGTP